MTIETALQRTPHLWVVLPLVALPVLTKHRERHKLPLVGVVLVGLVQYAQAMYTRPIAPYLDDRVTPDGVVLQSSGASCVPASAANIVRLLGGHATEKGMAEVLGSADGTSPAQVVYGMRGVGLECELSELTEIEPTKLSATERCGHRAAAVLAAPRLRPCA